MFYGFSLYNPINNANSNHCIMACSSYSTDFNNMESVLGSPRLLNAASPVDVKFKLRWWHKGFGLAKAAIQSLIEQTREDINNSHSPSNQPFMFASALQTFKNNFDTLNVTTPSLAM
ncbi:hypothetical protein CTA1_10816 [Colletotrichum tanaceti]|uniref:Uncharacterized protein n=1 Tax=Colletotrichum tanaceti TaxID=1306861 RepID=A0A4U6WYG4_9PEZI|nr:hypothetical protein CTA1_10816 [Colletotrichum tanaceti]